MKIKMKCHVDKRIYPNNDAPTMACHLFHLDNGMCRIINALDRMKKYEEYWDVDLNQWMKE